MKFIKFVDGVAVSAYLISKVRWNCRDEEKSPHVQYIDSCDKELHSEYFDKDHRAFARYNEVIKELEDALWKAHDKLKRIVLYWPTTYSQRRDLEDYIEEFEGMLEHD